MRPIATGTAAAVIVTLVLQALLSAWMLHSDVVSALLSAHGGTPAELVGGAAAFLGVRMLAMFGVPLVVVFVAVWIATGGSGRADDG